MLYKNLMISALRKQKNLLEDLITKVEEKPRFGYKDYSFCQERMKLIHGNLKKIRLIQSGYCMALDEDVSHNSREKKRRRPK